MKLELNESANFPRKTPSFSSLTLIPLLKFLGKKPLSNCGVLLVTLFRAARAAALSVTGLCDTLQIFHYHELASEVCKDL